MHNDPLLGKSDSGHAAARKSDWPRSKAPSGISGGGFAAFSGAGGVAGGAGDSSPPVAFAAGDGLKGMTRVRDCGSWWR